MDPHRFDAITRQLGTARSRRGVLATLGAAALGAVGLTRPAGAAPGGNSACAAFCAQVFGTTRAAGQCTSDAAHGRGLCYQCGPKSDHSQQVCGQTCIPTSSCCVDSDCADNDVCTTDQCLNGQCAYTNVDCDDGNPCTTDSCDPSSGCMHTMVVDGTGCTTANVAQGTCQGGTCVICAANDSTCTQPSDCCSGNCFNSVCADFVTMCGTSSCGGGDIRGCAGDNCCGPPAFFSCADTCCGPPATGCCNGNCC